MTPEEYADLLITDIHYLICSRSQIPENDGNYLAAKEISLLCVGKILDKDIYDLQVDYFEKVKQHLINL